MKPSDIIERISEKYEFLDNWTVQLDSVFPRRNSGYHSLELDKVSVENKSGKFEFPIRITFLDKITNNNQHCIQEYRIDDNQTIIKVLRYTYQLSFYERDDKIPYTGDTSEILLDVFKEHKINFESVHLSKEIETYTDNLLYSLNSNIKWASYILFLKGEILESKTTFIISDDGKRVLNDLGINLPFDESLKSCLFIIFPMPYIKIAENKIVKNGDGTEDLLIVLEKNSLRWNFNMKNELKIKSIIKNTDNEIIDERITPISDKDNSRYYFEKITPKVKQSIGFSEIRVFIDNILVDLQSGYYIRNIKVNVTVKGN